MDCFNILGIPYDSDYKTIKSAYAKLLKIHNPEEDPKGYQELRQAYDEAIKYEKNHRNKVKFKSIKTNDLGFENKTLKNEVEINSVDCEKEIDNAYKKKQLIKDNKDKCFINEKETSSGNEISQFLSRLNEIYIDISLRTNEDKWNELFKMDVVYDMYRYNVLEKQLFYYISEHKFLPRNIWRIIDKYFNFNTNKETLCEKFSKHLVDEILSRINTNALLSYNGLEEIDSNYIDDYLYFREQAYFEDKLLGNKNINIGFENKEFIDPTEYLIPAYNICSTDPEILRLIGNYYLYIDNIDGALSSYENVLKKDKNDLETALKIGKIFVFKKRYLEAIPYLQSYLSFGNEDNKVREWLAYCYYSIDDFMNAMEHYKILRDLDPSNAEFKSYILYLNKKINGKSVKTIYFNAPKIYFYKGKSKVEDTPKEDICEQINKNLEPYNSRKARIWIIIIFIFMYVILIAIKYLDKK